MSKENNFQLIHIGIQWYVIGNGHKIPVEDEISGLLLIDQLNKEAGNSNSDRDSLTSKSSSDSDYVG